MFRPLTSPRMVGLHLLAIAAVMAAVLLGLWQYDAWQTRRDHQVQGLANAASQPLSTVMSADDPFPGRSIGQPVEFRGTWLPKNNFFVADRSLRGRTGYWAITPVAVCPPSSESDCATTPAMLVVRGWTPRPKDAPSAPRGPVDVAGWLQPTEDSGAQDPDPNDDVLAEVRIADALQRVDQDLYGAYVISAAPEAGLERVTPASLPQPETFTAIRNLLYALEWWVFGGFAVFLWWRWCSDEIKARSSESARSAEVASSP